jgi:hypothetical protein
MPTRKQALRFAMTVVIAGSIPVLSDGASAQNSQPVDQRKATYAPWSPDQMAQRRKEFGLIGPGATKPGAAPGVSILSEEA